MTAVQDVAGVAICVAISVGAALPLGLELFVALSMGIQVLVWAPSAWFQNERFYDFTGMITFIVLAITSQLKCFQRFFGEGLMLSDIVRQTPRYLVATALVLVWTLRLGTFLFKRILRDGHDSRFADVRDKPLKFLFFYAVQGMWVFFTPLAMLALHTLDPKGGGDTGAIRGADALGLVVWAVGFALEVIADNQKKVFKMAPGNKSKFIDVGLWSRCRHPNYVGEMVLWAGFFLFCSRGVLGGAGWATLGGPVFVAALLIGVSTPMIEEAADKKYGGLAAYQDYKRRTPSLFFRLS